MVESRTPRVGLPQWSAGTDGPSRADFNEAFAALETLTAIDQQGTLAQRPAAGKRGRWWYDTGNGFVYRDTGTAWVTVAGDAMMPRTGGTFTGPVTVDGGITVYGPGGRLGGGGNGGSVQIGDDVRIVDDGIPGTARIVGVQNPNGGDLYSGQTGTARFWHAGNDGAGSGLDADRLDGRDGVDYRSTAHVATSQTAATVTGATPLDLNHVTVSRPMPFTVTASVNVFLDYVNAGSVWAVSLRFYVVGGPPVEAAVDRQTAQLQDDRHKAPLRIPSTVLADGGFGGGSAVVAYLTVARGSGGGNATILADRRFNRLDVQTHPI